MISLCIPSRAGILEAPAVTSALERLTGLGEIVIASAHERMDTMIGGIRVIITDQVDEVVGSTPHGNLHTALSMATGDYVLISDDDVTFQGDVATYYRETLEERGLDLVGCSHYLGTMSYGKFPCVINCMMRRSELPGPDFLEGELWTADYYSQRTQRVVPCDGRWLVPGGIGPYVPLYPYRNGHFDVGHNLWLWAHQNDWSWLSFLPQTDGHRYTSSRWESNVPDFDLEPGRPLIWHRTSQGDALGVRDETPWLSQHNASSRG